MRRWLVASGLVALGLGVFGIYDDYFVVIEFIKGAIQPVTALLGFVALVSGLLGRKAKIPQVSAGLVLLGFGAYGFYDEYFAVIDFMKGAIPPVLLAGGMVSVVSGVQRLK